MKKPRGDRSTRQSPLEPPCQILSHPFITSVRLAPACQGHAIALLSPSLRAPLDVANDGSHPSRSHIILMGGGQSSLFCGNQICLPTDYPNGSGNACISGRFCGPSACDPGYIINPNTGVCVNTAIDPRNW